MNFKINDQKTKSRKADIKHFKMGLCKIYRRLICVCVLLPVVAMLCNRRVCLQLDTRARCHIQCKRIVCINSCAVQLVVKLQSYLKMVLYFMLCMVSDKKRKGGGWNNKNKWSKKSNELGEGWNCFNFINNGRGWLLLANKWYDSAFQRSAKNICDF